MYCIKSCTFLEVISKKTHATWKLMQIMSNVNWHLDCCFGEGTLSWFVSALSKEIIHSPISISPVLFMTHYFVSSYCCCILGSDTLFRFHLFSCIILCCHITTIYIISSPTCIYYLRIFYKSNLRTSIGYLQPLVDLSLHLTWTTHAPTNATTMATRFTVSWNCKNLEILS